MEQWMYLRGLELENIRLFESFNMDLMGGGQHRQWTVITGACGSGKTTVLQAIAMAANGKSIANELSNNIKPRFGYSGFSQIKALFGSVGSEDLIKCSLRYSQGSFKSKGELNVLDKMRTSYTPNPEWFIASYGVDRQLPSPQGHVMASSVGRMKSLFERSEIPSTRWLDHFRLTGNTLASDNFRNMLDTVVKSNMFPHLFGVNLGCVDGAAQCSPLERHRIYEVISGVVVDIPTVWASKGTQSTLAWVADLIGQVLLERPDISKTCQMTGLVLIDGLGLHLDPERQSTIVQSVKDLFPNMQFIVTSNAPTLLQSCPPNEIVRLDMRDSS